MPSKLSALEEELSRIRSGGISPVTALLWRHDRDFITERARTISRGNSRILDVGCGRGGYLISLARETRNVCCGIDPLLEVSLKPAQKNANEEGVVIHLLRAVGESIPFRDGAFDVVLTVSTLQHVANQNKALSEIWRVLKPGGLVLVSVPQLGGIYSARRFVAKIVQRLLSRREIFTMDFDARRLKSLMAENGFSVSRLWGRKFMPVLLPSLLSVLLRLRRENMVVKIIEISDKSADRVAFLASNLVALCAKEKGN